MEPSPEHWTGILTSGQVHISPGDGQEAMHPRRKRRWVHSLWMTLLLALGVLFGATNTQFGRDQVRDVLEGQLNAMLTGAHVSIGSLEGNLLSGVTAHDIRLVRDTGREMLHAERVRVDYRLMPLLASRVDLSLASMDAVTLEAMQGEDGLWDWATLMTPSDEEGAWAIEVDSIIVEGFAARARFHSAGRDSTLDVHSLSVSAGGMEIHVDEGPRLQSLVARGTFQPPVRMDTVRLALEGAYADDMVRLDTLSLTSALSQVQGGGDLDLSAIPLFAFMAHAEGAPEAQVVRGALRIEASPLAFADLAAIIPGLNPQANLQADLQITQQAHETELEAVLGIDGGGGATALVRWAERPDGSALAAAVKVDALDIERLMIDSLGTSHLTATLEVDVQGTSPDSLNGRVDFAADPATAMNMRLDSTRVSALVSDGYAEAQLETGVNGAVVGADLSGRWLDAIPTAVLKGMIAGVDVSRWLDESELSSDGTVAIKGQWVGNELTSAIGELDLIVLPSRLGTAASIQGQVSMSLNEAVLNWQGEMTAGDGRVDTEGVLSVAEGLNLEEFRFETSQLDVAAMMGDDAQTAPPSRVSVSLAGAGSLEDWRSGQGGVEMTADSLLWGSWRLQHAASSASWNAGSGRIGLSLHPTDTSDVSLDLGIEARGDRTRITSRSVEWRDINPASVADVALPEAALNGSGSLEVDVRGTRVDQLAITLESAPSRWGMQQIENALLRGQGTAEELVILGSGRMTPVATEIGQSAEVASWQVEGRIDRWQEEAFDMSADIDFTSIDPAAFVGMSDEGTALTGSARATGRIQAGHPEQATFEVQIEPSTLRGEPVARANIEGSLRDSLITAEAQMDVAEGRLASRLTLRPFDAVPSFTAAGRAHQVNLLPLVGRRDLDSDVNLTWDIRGSSLDPHDADWHLEVMGQPSQLDALSVENLSLQASWNGSVLNVTELSSLFNAGSIEVNGRLNLDPNRSDEYSDLRATWYAGDLHAFERLARLDRLSSRSGTLDMQVFGPAGQLDAELLVSVSDLEVDSWRMASLESSTWITLDEDMLPVSTTASVDLGYVSLPTLGVRTTSVEVDQQGDLFAVQGSSMIDMGNRVELDATVNPFADRPWIALRDMELTLGGEAFGLDRAANLIIDDGWQLSRVELSSRDQSLSMSGGLDSTGYGMQIDLEYFDVHPIALLANYPELEGRLGATVILTGRPKAPLISSHIDLGLTDSGQDLARVLADLQSTPQGVRLDGSVLIEDEENLAVQGFVPVFAGLGIADDKRADRSADLDLSIASQGGSLRWIAPFLDPTVIADLEGETTADIQVRGTIDEPFLSGYLNLDDARFRLPELGVTYRLDELRSTLDGVTIAVEQARLRSGDGSMDITGAIDFASLTNSSFDLQAQLSRFRAVRNDELHTTISGDLQLTGRTTRPELQGRLRTQNTSFWITDTAGGDVAQVPLSFDDEVMLADNFGYRTVVADTLVDAIWKGLSLDLSVVLERDTWIRQRVNPEMAIELSGRMEIQKDRGQEDLNLYRSIEVVPDRSIIKQFGRDFRINEGVASFNGPIEEMMMQVEAEYEVPSRLNPGQPEVVITLRLDGRLDDLAFNLSSDPAMDNTDIVSYIATGRPASESLQFGGTDFNNQMLVGVAASQLAGLVEGVASQSLGLDVVSIEQDGLKGTRLTAGKYVTPRLFVGVTQPITFSSGSNLLVDDERELTLEYKILEYLLLQLLADASDSPVRVNLAGRYSY